MTFFDKYSYKQKNYALLVIIVLLLAVTYKRAISVTLETKQYKNDLNLQLEIAKSASSQIKQKQSLIKQLNRVIGKENSTVEKVQQGFLNFFAKQSSGLFVYKIDEVIKFQHPDFTINTHQIVLKGDYTNTLKFIYKLEKDFDLARLTNVSFEYKKVDSEQPEALYTTLLIQNYLK